MKPLNKILKEMAASDGQKLGMPFDRNDYRDEQWIIFARKIRRDAGNACEQCRRSDVTTQVHHKYYVKGRRAWQYQRNEVTLLCVSCHEQMHEQLQQFRKYVFGKLNHQSFRILNGALCVGLDHYDPLELMHAFATFISDPKRVKSAAMEWQR